MITAKVEKIFNTSNSFYNKGIIFTILSLLAAIFNYGLYPAISHILTVSSFGEFSALLALITQIGGIMLAFNVISIYLVARYGEDKSKYYLAIIQKSLITFIVVVSLLCILAFPIIGSLLKISSFVDLLILAGILLCTIPVAIWSGYFQGNGEIVKVGAFSLFAAFSKLILAIFGAFYWGLTGALIGVLAGTIIGLIIFWILPGSKPPLSQNIKFSDKDIKVLKKFYALISRAVIAIALLSILQIIDLLSVKALYSPEMAGQYAGISTLSRIVYYVGFIIVWVLLPEIAKATKNHRKKLILKSYVLYLLISIVSGFGALFVGKQAISMVLGANYGLDISVMIWAVLFQSAALFVTFQAYVLMVLSKKVIFPLVVGLFGILVCIFFADQSILSLVRGLALCTIVLSIWLGLLIINQDKKNEEAH